MRNTLFIAAGALVCAQGFGMRHVFGAGDGQGEPHVAHLGRAHLAQSSQPNIDDLMGLSNGNTHSAVTPMGVHFEQACATSPSDAQLTLWNDAMQQPPIPSSISGQSWRHFEVNLYPFGMPNPADINQHAIGDCDGDSALATLASQHPYYLMNAITKNADGTFTVHVFGPHGYPRIINVDTQFLADNNGNLGQVSGKNNVANWASVVEKAIMKYVTVYGTSDGHGGSFSTDIGGIGSEVVLPMFVGQGDSFAFAPGSLTPTQMARVVQVSLANGMMITGGFNQNGYPIGQDATVSGHGYAVYLPSVPGAMQQMRNPWGVSPFAVTSGQSGYDTGNDGLLNIPESTTWSQIVDLRIVNSGRAVSFGRTTPYMPPAGAHVAEGEKYFINITEPDAQRFWSAH